MLFRRISFQFMTGFCILGEEMVCFKIVLKTKYIFLMLGKWDCTSVVKRIRRQIERSVVNITVNFRKTLDV